MLRSKRRPHDLEAGDVLRCQDQYIANLRKSEKENADAEKLYVSLPADCTAAIDLAQKWDEYFVGAKEKADKLSRAGLQSEACLLYSEIIKEVRRNS